jgi:hypothetical protein
VKRRAVLSTGVAAAAGLAGCLGETEYRITGASADAAPAPLSVSVRVVDADATVEGPAAVVLSLANDGADPVRVRSYGVWPFGVLALAPSPTPGDRGRPTRLFSPSYAASDRVEVGRGGASVSMDGTPLRRTLAAGERVERRYELHGEDVQGSGTWYVVQNFDGRASGYATGDDWTRLDYRVRLGIEAIGRLPV